MKRKLTLALALCLSCGAFAQEQEIKAVIETNLGNMTVKLYNDTPLHRDAFVRLVKEGHYDGTLFYRVIKEFMLQGGSDDSRNARPGQVLGYGKDIDVQPEFRPNHYHKKGALAAPRQPDNMNADKVSDIAQFYIVHGKQYTEAELDNYIKSVNVPIKREIQKKYYHPKKPLLDSLRAAHAVEEFREVARLKCLTTSVPITFPSGDAPTWTASTRCSEKSSKALTSSTKLPPCPPTSTTVP